MLRNLGWHLEPHPAAAVAARRDSPNSSAHGVSCWKTGQPIHNQRYGCGSALNQISDPQVMSQAISRRRLSTDWTEPMMNWQTDIDTASAEPMATRCPNRLLVRAIESLEADGATASFGNGLHVQDLIFIFVFLFLLLSFLLLFIYRFSLFATSVVSGFHGCWMTAARMPAECPASGSRDEVTTYTHMNGVEP